MIQDITKFVWALDQWLTKKHDELEQDIERSQKLLESAGVDIPAAITGLCVGAGIILLIIMIFIGG